jgi:fructokinase
VVDVNARPAVVGDRSAFVTTARAVLARADVVKVSDEDLAVLAPEFDVTSILAGGARLVIVTSGSSPTQLVHSSGTRSVEVPPLMAPIVDTIGAGDTFIGAFMAAWTADGLGRGHLAGDVGLEHAVRAVQAGHLAAGVVVTRHGADPPTSSDLPTP